MNREEIEKLLDGTTPGPWNVQDFTAPEVNDDPMAGDVYVSCTWPDHICVASMGGGFHGYKALEQARADAAAIATWPDLARTALSLMDQLAESQAAQAALVERAAEASKAYAQKMLPSTRRRPRPSCCSQRITLSVGRSIITVPIFGTSTPSLNMSTAKRMSISPRPSCSRDVERGADPGPEWTATARKPWLRK